MADALTKIVRTLWRREPLPMWAMMAATTKGMQALWDECADDVVLRNLAWRLLDPNLPNTGQRNFCGTACFMESFRRECPGCCRAIRRRYPTPPALDQLLELSAPGR